MGYEHYTVQLKDEWGEARWNVYGWGTYPAHSVLAGQPMKVYLDSFNSEAEALKAYPAAQRSNSFIEPQVSLSHLPGEDDPVPGGMYPDDLSLAGDGGSP